MNKKLIATLSLLTMGALISCSDSGTSADNSGITASGSSSGITASSSSGEITALPTIEGAPEQTTLTANNSQAATPVQVQEDLQALAELDQLGSSLEMANPAMGGFPMFGMLDQAKSRVSLTRKQLMAYGACQAYPSEDSTYSEDGMSVHMKMQYLGSDGNPLETCEPETQAEANAVINQFDGAQLVMAMTGTSDTVDMTMNMVMTIDMEGTNQDISVGISAQANMLIDVKIPKSFNMYMELDMEMGPTSMYSESEPDMSISMVIWFQNGRYKCEVDYAILQDEAVGKVCDLVNAGTTVGSLWSTTDGEMEVKDAEGNVISGEEIVDETLGQ